MFLNKELCANGISLCVETRIALLDEIFWESWSALLSGAFEFSIKLTPRVSVF